MVDEFSAQLEVLMGVTHHVPTLDDARATARSLIAGDTVARWRDEVLEDIAPPSSEREPAEAVVSLIVGDVGVAATGAIGFVHGPGRPRAAALLPERQIALLAEENLVATVPEALARYFASDENPPGSLVFAAGPSRTADIEQRVIMGVHAPRTLDVIVYGALR